MQRPRCRSIALRSPFLGAVQCSSPSWSPIHFGALGASGRRSMLLVLVHLRCVGAIFTGGRHHPRARSCAGLGHHCALAATVPNDPAFIDGAREALSEAVASACVVVSGRCEGCASCISLYCDSTGLGNTHQGRRAAHERSTRPVTTNTSHQKVHTRYRRRQDELMGGCSTRPASSAA